MVLALRSAARHRRRVLIDSSEVAGAKPQSADRHASGQDSDRDANAQRVDDNPETRHGDHLGHAPRHEIGGENAPVLVLGRRALDERPGWSPHQCGHQPPQHDTDGRRDDPWRSEVDEGGDT